MKVFRPTCFIVLLGIFLLSGFNLADSNKSRIKPYLKNKSFWQYKNKPVLLLGASDDDNLFQFPNLESHLDLMHKSGGNFIRNTMSSRDSGNVWPFYQRPDGKYDLEKWNQEYWDRFDNLLKLAHQRDIVIQIEIWDRFDYSREPWLQNPFNPANNINYTESESRLKTDYPLHPGSDVQPFFHTVKGLPLYHPDLELVKKYQRQLVDQILAHSLKYGNILYCMDNETSTPPGWGKYWMNYLHQKAGKKEIYTTDMFNSFYTPNNCSTCLAAIEQTTEYQFLDVSQINSRLFGQNHWDTLQWIIEKRNQHDLRPVNCTKVYGGGHSGFGSGSNKDGVERFYRNVLGGCAAVRHHRPPSGNGLNQQAQASIKTIRKIEEIVKLWELQPRMDKLENRDENEAYLSANEKSMVFYFTDGGSVTVNLSGHNNTYQGKWIDADQGEWANDFTIEGGGKVQINPPSSEGQWMLVCTSNKINL